MAGRIQAMLVDVLDHHRRQAMAVDAAPIGNEKAETTATVAATVLGLLVVCLMAVLMGMT